MDPTSRRKRIVAGGGVGLGVLALLVLLLIWLSLKQ